MLGIVALTHAALWFLPLAETPSGLIATFLAMVAVPLIAAQCVYYSLFDRPQTSPKP